MGFIIRLFSPWMNEQSANYSYRLINQPQGAKLYGIGDQIIPIPVRRVVVLSTTHLAFIEALGEISSIVGISDSRYVNSEKFWEHHQKLPVANVGSESAIDFEALLQLKPDVCLFYGISSAASQTAERILSLGIPVVFISEFNESTPLGRLEWIRYVGCFYAKLSVADSIFLARAESYQKILKLVSSVETYPTVFTGFPWKEVWNVPGANSFTAILIRDARGNYVFNHLDEKVNYQLSLEEVFSQAAKADIWINIGTITSVEEIKMSDYRMENFRAFQTGQLYNNNRRQNIYGGNDYMESGILYPDSILLDLISIFHPHLLPDHKPRYYQKLK